MIVGIINSHLKSNRRLVIPSFGAFVVKDGGEIIFSELLKKDDGVLRELMMAGGKSEIEVAGAIDRFIFEVRHELQNSGICPIADLGTFRRTDDGMILFDAIKPVVEEAVAEVEAPIEVVEPVQPVQPVKPVQPQPKPQPRPQRPAARGQQPRRSGGFIMWFAVTVILAALLALGYGLYCKWSAPDDNLDAQMDAQRIPMIEIPKSSTN